ncbi:hypothetical protein ITJ57_10460 [Plantibacter sp. VKM Ac-2880]|uniref:hypothetical protein n=1 Tax=Plantibacter sp. VKM Ac-2880 TaxID=2783827 RepID=UPI0018909EC2|nr:hypothetical protein [Plantibacter sp. VKM Ac-2880]MBF4569186.1 hypothetical protein [Plantibacter sp. VKM Ac-2880]
MVLVAAVILLPALPVLAAPTARAEVRTAECVVEVPGGSRCGELSVPISREVAESAQATLPYVVVPATLDTGRMPLVYLAGDTPLSELDVSALAVERGLAADRDVVFVERRGGADAAPTLACDPAVEAFRSALGTEGSREERVAAVAAAFTGCAEAWQEDGFSASDFGVQAAAADLRDLRQELGYARWTLLAVGSSAGVALTATGVDPEGVEGVLLDGPDLGAPGIVSSGGVEASLSMIRARGDDRAPSPSTPEETGTSDAGPATASAPILDTSWSAERLTAASEALTASPHRTGGARPTTIGGDALLALVSHGLSDPTTQAALPVLLETVADGHRAPLDPLAAAAVDDLSRGGVLGRVLGCSTAAWPGATERTGPEPQTTTLLEDVAAAACTAFGVAASPTPPPLDLPLLVVSAPEQDAAWASPPTDLATAAVAAVFPGSGAVPTANSSCASVMVRSWLSEPSSHRAALCAGDDAAIPVIDAADVSTSARWSADTAGIGGPWPVLVLPILFALVAIGWSIAWAYRLFAQALRHEPVQAGLRLGIAPVFGASWAVGAAALLVRDGLSSPAVGLIGVPAALPWLSIALLVSCMGLVPVWEGARRGSRVRTVAISTLWAATALWTTIYVLAWW